MDKVTALKTLDNIIARHPLEVGQLFQRYGIKAELSPETLVDAAIVYDEPFVSELYRIHASTPLSSYHGDEYSYEGGQPEENKFKAWMQKAVGVIKGIGTAISAAKGTPAAAPIPLPSAAPVEDRILGLNKYVFYALAGVAALVAVLIIIRRGK